MPVNSQSDGTVLTASFWNTNVRDQVVSTVTSGTRPAGTEGQIIYETDTDLLYIYNGGWVRFGASGAWASYTPTVTQSAGVTKTVNYAKYEKIGRKVVANVLCTVTGTGAANNLITVTLPFTASSSGLIVGSGVVFDSSAGTNYPVVCYLGSTTVVQFFDATAGTGVFTGQTGAAFSAALASGDAITFSITYESST